MKKIKMVLYGEPGEGKSTFVSKAKNPFFITTDGNFEWLDLPEENHKQIFSFVEFKQIVKDMLDNPSKYEKFDTIAVDLLEDVFKWCEYEFCKKNRIEHVGDMGYGKGYDVSRNEFYIEVSKLLGIDKNVVLIAHGITKIETTNRGVNITKYAPSERIPSKVWDMVEGRVRYFLRCFSKDEETSNGKFVKRRYLSLIPKQGEYGITRGLDEAKVPEDIILDWNTFVEVIGLGEGKETPTQTTKVVEPKVEVAPKVEVTAKSIPHADKPTADSKRKRLEKETKVEEVVKEENTTEIPAVGIERVVEETTQPVVETTPVVEAAPVVEEPKKELTLAEKLARIRAKNAELNKK